MCVSVTLVMMVVTQATLLLPGVEPFEDIPWPVNVVILVLAVGLLLVAPMLSAAPSYLDRGLQPPEYRAELSVALRKVGNALGLKLNARGWVRAAALGLVAATGWRVVVELLLHFPAMTENAGPDARHFASAHATPFVAGLRSALGAAPWEEPLWRGTLLVVAAVVWARVAQTWVRRVLIFGVLALLSLKFGEHHLVWSMLNAVSAGLGGLFVGLAALAQRSIWPALIGHALYNFTAWTVHF